MGTMLVLIYTPRCINEYHAGMLGGEICPGLNALTKITKFRFFAKMTKKRGN